MPICPTCGTTLDAATRFCPKDGTTIKPEPAPKPAPVAVVASGERDDVGTRPLATAKSSGNAAVAGGAPDPLVGATIDGRYHIRERLGQGGVGAVYQGEHVETKRLVAVKVLHAVFAGTDEFHRRFEREAQAASKLSASVVRERHRLRARRARRAARRRRAHCSAFPTSSWSSCAARCSSIDWRVAR